MSEYGYPVKKIYVVVDMNPKDGKWPHGACDTQEEGEKLLAEFVLSGGVGEIRVFVRPNF